MFFVYGLLAYLLVGACFAIYYRQELRFLLELYDGVLRYDLPPDTSEEVYQAFVATVMFLATITGWPFMISKLESLK